MNVIGRVPGGIGLDVEELDHECRPLDPVSMRLAWIRTAGVGEMDVVYTTLFDLSHLRRGDIFRHARRISPDKLEHKLLLLAIQFSIGDSLWLADVRGTAVLFDLGELLVLKGNLALLLIKRLEKFPGQVVCLRKRARAFARALFHRGWVGA